MSELTDVNRRRFLQTTAVGATGLAAGGSELIQATQAQTVPVPTQPFSSGIVGPMGPSR